MIYKLIYAVKTGIVKTLEEAFEKDPEFYPDKTGVSRSNVPRVVDGWNYELRDFPAVVITGSSGGNRREGIADAVDSVNTVILEKSTEDGGSPNLRIFRVNDFILVGSNVTVKNPATNPSDVTVLVENGTGTDLGKKVIRLTGPAVGPDTVYPLSGFSAVSEFPTGDRFGGWYNLSVEITCIARNTLERERLADKVLSLIWYTKKKYLRDTYNVHIFDVKVNGETEEKYGADMLYFSNASITCATEWEEVKWYTDVVEEVVIDATSPTLINEQGN